MTSVVSFFLACKKWLIAATATVLGVISLTPAYAMAQSRALFGAARCMARDKISPSRKYPVFGSPNTFFFFNFPS